MTENASNDSLDLGPQPLQDLLSKWSLTSHDLIDASTEQLNFKQVQRAAKGRRLTLKMMQKVCRAFNVAIWYKLSKEDKEQYFEYMHKHLFNYAKGYDADFIDPNNTLAHFQPESSEE